jgi:antitoxin ParD1/3/4
MPKETTLRLENYFLAFIEDQIAKGRFNSPGAVVQAGLRLLEERESALEDLRDALREGEESGEAQPFDLDEFLGEMHEKAAAKKVPGAA